ncbi:hypothetical protein GF323_01680 [Candidatus Woesearchaeota archaeon]|nr:hypothetical protein [Candidatus Woesearchaeota archaeon]
MSNLDEWGNIIVPEGKFKDYLRAAYHRINNQKTYLPLSNKFQEYGYSTRVVNPKHLTLIAEPPPTQ